MGSWGKVLLVAALMLPAFAPLAQAEYCPPQLRIYGRASFAPGIVPPDEPLRAECVISIQAVETLDKTLPPGTTQITMRIFGDLGDRRIAVDLDGLGWHTNKFYLDRYDVGGQIHYAIEWLYVPDTREDDGTLRASFRFPHREKETVEYHVFPIAAATTLGRT